MRVKMIVAYDGTNYCGWQIQPNGITIEQVLNEHLSRLLKEDIKVTGIHLEMCVCLTPIPACRRKRYRMH